MIVFNPFLSLKLYADRKMPLHLKEITSSVLKVRAKEDGSTYHKCHGIIQQKLNLEDSVKPSLKFRTGLILIITDGQGTGILG